MVGKSGPSPCVVFFVQTSISEGFTVDKVFRAACMKAYLES